MTSPEPSPLMALFGQREEIPGDETLLALARERLLEAGLGAEFYPESPDQLRSLLALRPGSAPCTAHLPRSLDPLIEAGRDEIAAYARTAAGRLLGLIVHDRATFRIDPAATRTALEAMSRALLEIPGAPRLFVENSGQLSFAETEALAQTLLPLPGLGICLDISHLAIAACHARLDAAKLPTDARALLADPRLLAERMPVIERAAAEARAEALLLIGRVAAREQPIHFHVHDGHPLSTLSRYGVCDHLSFLQPIRLPLAWQGKRQVPGCYGVDGLRQFAETVAAAAPPARCSFLLEIHPQPGRRPLGDHAGLFVHWQDLRNAEQANAWQDTLIDNAGLLRSFLSAARRRTP